jgi:hypothetical protein
VTVGRPGFFTRVSSSPPPKRDDRRSQSQCDADHSLPSISVPSNDRPAFDLRRTLAVVRTKTLLL